MQVRYKGGGGTFLRGKRMARGGGGVSPPKVWILGFFIVKLGDNFWNFWCEGLQTVNLMKIFFQE